MTGEGPTISRDKGALSDWRVWAGILVSVIALYFAFRDADFAKVFESSRRVRWGLLLAVVPLFIAVNLIRAYRWSFFINADTSSLRTRYDAMMIGFLATNLLPLRIGELVRAVVFARKSARSAMEVVATIAAERVFDLIALGIIAVVTVPFLPVEGVLLLFQEKISGATGMEIIITRNHLLAASIAGTVFLLGGFLIFCRFGRAALELLAEKYGIRGSKVYGYAESFLGGVETPIRNKSLVKVIIFSVFTWGILCVANWAALFAFPAGESNLGRIAGFSGAIFFELIICAAIALPSAPGFVGVWQLASKIAFVPYAATTPGLDEGVLAFAVVFHLYVYVLTIALGFESLVNQGLSFKQIRSVRAEG